MPGRCAQTYDVGMTIEQVAHTTIEFGPPHTPEEAADIREGLRRFTADCKLLAAKHDELLAQHGDQWVAMHEGTLFAASELEPLFDALRASGVIPGHAAVRFLHRVPPAHFHDT